MAGLGENSRVLRWIIERLEGTADAVETPIRRTPTPESLDVTGLELSDDEVNAVLAVDPDEWKAQVPQRGEWFEKFGAKLPTTLWTEPDGLKARLGPG